MKDLTQCTTVFTATIVICLLSSFTSATSPASTSSTNVKPFIQSNPMEGRSLLDLLLGGSSEGNAATSVKGSSSGEKNPLAELAQSLIGKDNGNANLYIKIFKLILNLFMDVMMDRMDVDKRREDISPSPILSLLRPKNFILKRSSSSPFERPVESMVERQRVFKPYFVE